jgi:hypothetical protein
MEPILRGGIRVERTPTGIRVANNRRCRVAVQAGGANAVIPAAGPRDWWPSVQLDCDPASTVVVTLEAEGPQGPDPSKTGDFEPGEHNIIFEGC